MFSILQHPPLSDNPDPELTDMPNDLLNHLRDLHRHMAWADAILFRAWGKSAFQEDPDLLSRMQHTVDVQAAFLKVFRGETMTFPAERPAPDFATLRALVQVNHKAYETLIQSVTPQQLSRTYLIPWFPAPPCQVTLSEALTQVALHTQHHRGQLMARLKALGASAQNVDYIIWVWKERPEGRWV